VLLLLLQHRALPIRFTKLPLKSFSVLWLNHSVKLHQAMRESGGAEASGRLVGLAICRQSL
jgi:hypothetical protein